MRYLTFGKVESNSYPICFLLKHLRTPDIGGNYITPLETMGISRDKVISYALDGVAKNNKERLVYLKELLPILTSLQVEYLVVCDGHYFKQLTKSTKAEAAYGYVRPCTIKDYEHINVLYCPAYGQLFYNPTLVDKITLSLHALAAHINGTYADPGDSIIKFAEYPREVERISYWLERLIVEAQPLTADIETFGLKHYDAGIGSISFAWNMHEGIAFTVDIYRSPEESAQIRKLLASFFRRFHQKIIWHNISFDAYILIYQLYMENLLDTHGMYTGMDCFLHSWDDTKVITYLATNTCSGNKLKLKEIAQEFAGDWAVDVKDITKVSEEDLLRYNLVDALSTWYAYHKNHPKMVADNQEEIYETLFKPIIWDIIQMQLTGLPINMAKVQEAKVSMQAASDKAVSTVLSSPLVHAMELKVAEDWAEARNKVLVKKRVTAADYTKRFNLNSPLQMQRLLYEELALPVLDFSATHQPSTEGDAIKKLTKQTDDPQKLDVLSALIDFKQVDKILTSFIPAFEAAPLGPDGCHYLFGAFNLGGTVSGRLSSSKVNLQQLPSTGTIYAKPIKQAFMAPPGKLFVGVDFNGLEDRISALTTQDPVKLAVYTDGYDGHSLRAFYYFRELMPDIVNTVDSINSIQVKYKHLRQDSKAPTFALTYQGTYITLMNNCGFSEVAAREIESRYHELYVVSDQWVQSKIQQAGIDGYVTVAFGLKLRTPLLEQVILGNRKTPYEAAAEARTAGNALGQSYGLLNSRAAMEFMQRVRNSPYKHRIRPCAQIHDAQYYLIDDDIEVLEWVNHHLIECVKWTELPEIQHPVVKLGGELTVFHPSWAVELAIPNDANQEQIRALALNHKEKISK